MERTLLLQASTGAVILRERRKTRRTQQALADPADLRRVCLVGIEGGKRSVILGPLFSDKGSREVTEMTFIGFDFSG